MITADIKINGQKIYTLKGVRYPGTKKTGLNAYSITLLDHNDLVLSEALTAHIYEEGAVKLIGRMAMELSTNHHAAKTEKITYARVSTRHQSLS